MPLTGFNTLTELILYSINLPSYSSWKGLLWKFVFFAALGDGVAVRFGFSTVTRCFAVFLATANPFPKFKTNVCITEGSNSYMIASLTCTYMHLV